jgi:hypothetical protein
VASQSAEAQQQAINAAFSQLLIRISGNSQILQNADIQHALPNVSNYIEQYTYVQTPLSGQNADGNPQATQLTLQVGFDQQQIRQLLQNAKQSIWGRDRPTVLMWAALVVGPTQNLLGLTTQDPTVALLQQLATQRGLPLLWPNITAAGSTWLADVLQPNLDNIKQASQSYNANTIVILHLTNNTTSWDAQATLLMDNQSTSWHFTANDAATVLQQTMNAITDTMAQHYMVSDEEAKSNITLTITHIETLEDFIKVQTYLKQLNPVRNAELLQLQAESAQFEIVYDGSESDLLSAIKLDHKLVPMQANNYQWQPNS